MTAASQDRSEPRIAIIAGAGVLPGLVAAALKARGATPGVFALEGHLPDGLEASVFRIEGLGPLLDQLVAEGYGGVCLAGTVRRPQIDPARIDARTRPLLAPIMAALGKGDDQLLGAVVTLFESSGLKVMGAHELVPDLVTGPGLLTEQAPEPDERQDADRGLTVLEALGPLDLGQACVIAGGLCLGIETVQGTEAMLRFIAGNRQGASRRGGVLVKRSKPMQDLRVDMPSIGPQTVAQAQEAGLGAIAIESRRVLILDRAATVAAADAAGIALWSM